MNILFRKWLSLPMIRRDEEGTLDVESLETTGRTLEIWLEQ